MITDGSVRHRANGPGRRTYCGQPVGTTEAVILEQLDRFAAQVMPAFKRT